MWVTQLMSGRACICKQVRYLLGNEGVFPQQPHPLLCPTMPALSTSCPPLRSVYSCKLAAEIVSLCLQVVELSSSLQSRYMSIHTQRCVEIRTMESQSLHLFRRQRSFLRHWNFHIQMAGARWQTREDAQGLVLCL